MTALRTVSYGGGVQSTALLVLAAQGVIDFRTFVFANVGDDSEHPSTLAYIEHVAAPLAKHHGIDLHEVRKRRVRGQYAGQVETLYGRLTREGSRSLPIPVRMSNGAPGNRSCTATYKIEVIGAWLKAHGASETDPATVGIGISLDEIHRVNARRAMPYELPVYPLLEHDPPLRRLDCERVITAHPLPPHIADALRGSAALADLHQVTRGDLVASGFAQVPRPYKSSCWFCPFHRPSTWAEMARDEPELFEKSCQLEDTLNARRDELGKDHVFLTRFNKPLRIAVGVAQDMLPLLDDNEDEGCDNGACFT